VKKAVVGSALAGAVLFALVLPGSATAATVSPSPPVDRCYPTCPPTVDVNDTTPSAGETIIVSGNNWCPNSTVDIYLDVVDAAHYLGTAKADSSGHFSIAVTIPPNTPPGNHTIIAVGLAYNCQETKTRSRTITVMIHGHGGGNVPFPGGPGAGEGNLPFTGGNISVGVSILAALLLVGAASLLLGRRRETPTGETPAQE